jgi:hypothetical protein
MTSHSIRTLLSVFVLFAVFVDRSVAAPPAPPNLAPTQAYSTFHPFETITFNWTAVPGAATYVLDAAKDPSFPILTTIHLNNIPNTTMSFEIADSDQGNYWARVYAVDASGVASVPSNLITFSVLYGNPVGPPPAVLSPANGTILVLPVTLTWAHVPNPQPSGYELQIAKDSRFSTIEEDDPQLNGPSRQVLSLTSGTKFWRVRSGQGSASATTAAFTSWSAAGTFTIPAVPPTPVSVTLSRNPLFSGQSSFVQLQLTSAVPAGGATISLTSSDSAALPIPATITMPGNTAWTQFDLSQFGMKAGQVTQSTPVTMTATLNAASAAGQFTVLPPSFQSLSISPSNISGGAQPGGIVLLNGQAPAGGALVVLTSDSAAVTPPPTVTVLPGLASVSFAINTSAVTTNTTATVTATWNGASVQSQVTLTAQQPPVSLTLGPTSTVGLGGGSFATVTIAAPGPSDEILQITSSNPGVATVSNAVMIQAGSTIGGVNIFTSPVSAQTLVTISVSGGGVTRTAILTVNPQASTPTPAPTPAPGPTATSTLTVTATGRSGERITSSAAGINVAVGSSGSATPVTGSAITLTVSNGRSAIWSGACSSNGSKVKSCSFTLGAAGAVTANVQ